MSGFVIASLLLTALTLYLPGSALVRDWEQRFQTRFHLFSATVTQPTAVSADIVVLLIDDASLPEDSPRSPLDRRWLASLINDVSGHQPRRIGLNILLDRPSTGSTDRLLADALARSGRVVVRSDPLYPALPQFIAAADAHGTVRFRVDSSGAVQETCLSARSCRSGQILLETLLKDPQEKAVAGRDWLRIDFAASSVPERGRRYVRVPVFSAGAVAGLPEGALRNKIVLIGPGFPDLYPLYRTPLPADEQFLHETELLAFALDTVVSGRSLRPVPPALLTILWLGLYLALSFLLVKRGVASGVWLSVIAIPVLFFLSASLFTFFRLELPFVLPALLMLLLLFGGSLQQVLQERLTRLKTELRLKEAKIDFLTNELHTHHLFNELSRLNVMIRRQPEQARAYLVEFAELLRMSLKYGDQPRVAVSVQLEYLKTYLQQQRIIHGEGFQFEFDISGNWESETAPWHVFYPLVENAVKASEQLLRSDEGQSVTIVLRLRRERGRLVLTVENPFLRDVNIPSTRRGLANLEERLRWFYPGGGTALAAEERDGTWRATLQLPLS